MEDPAQAATNLPCIFCIIIDESKTFNKHWYCHISRIVVLLIIMSGKKYYLSYLKSLSRAHWKSFSFDILDLIRDPGHRLTWLQDLNHFPDFRVYTVLWPEWQRSRIQRSTTILSWVHLVQKGAQTTEVQGFLVLF